MPQPKRAKATIDLKHVPAVPDIFPDLAPNGDLVFIDGDCRWRFDGAGRCKYFIRAKGGDLRKLPYEEVYRDLRP